MTLPGQRPPSSVDSLQVGITQVQLAPDQDDRCSRAKVLDLWVPHGLDMVQGIRVGNGEAENHHVGSGRGERGKNLVMGRRTLQEATCPQKWGVRCRGEGYLPTPTPQPHTWPVDLPYHLHSTKSRLCAVTWHFRDPGYLMSYKCPLLTISGLRDSRAGSLTRPADSTRPAPFHRPGQLLVSHKGLQCHSLSPLCFPDDISRACSVPQSHL